VKYVITILFAIVCAAGVTQSAEEANVQDLVLDLTCNISSDGPEVDSGVVVTRLYEYDPRLADVAATEITKLTIAGLTHKKGRNTCFQVPLRGKRSEDRNYYVTVFVHPSSGDERLYFIDGFQKVFEDADEQTLNITLAPVSGK